MFSLSVMSDSLQAYGPELTRLPCPSPSPWSLLKLMSFEWWCHPTILSSVIPFSSACNLSHKSVFFSELTLHIRWPKYWSFSFSISPSNEYSGSISFRIDWFDLLAVQGTLKSLLHHHISKASILQHLTFFMVQLSHPYVTTGKTITLIIWIFGSKVTSLLPNTLPRFIIVFLPGSKCLFISWLQSPSAVILEPPKIKSDTVSTVSPSIPQLGDHYSLPRGRSWQGQGS